MPFYPFKTASRDMSAQELRNLFGYHADVPSRTLASAWRNAKAPEVFFRETLGITTKHAYCAHRDSLRLALRLLANHQKEMKLRMRVTGGDSEAQRHHAMMKPRIAMLIAIRRAGKAWSAERATKRCEAAA